MAEALGALPLMKETWIESDFGLHGRWRHLGSELANGKTLSLSVPLR